MNKIFKMLLAGVVLMMPVSVSAEDEPIYESLSDVTIGRVFFTTSQRTHLDSLRGKRGTTVASSGKTRSTSSKPVNPDAAGFIVSSSGNARIYRNGDFVSVSSEPNVKFPDDVAVIRKPSEEAGAADDEAD